MQNLTLELIFFFFIDLMFNIPTNISICIIYEPFILNVAQVHFLLFRDIFNDLHLN